MASTNQQPTWVPYVPTRDCSQGFCSMYCPQWCYFLFPPPPPFSPSSTDPDASNGPIFSPLVIAVIGVLASAFLLVTYYAVVSRYCNPGSRMSFRRRHNTSADQPASGGSDYPTAWHTLTPANGLDETVIKKIAIWKYERGGLDGKVGSDCSVCLSEFIDGEDVRLLPKCTHAFHVECIDTWLKSHSNCPLCRASIVPTRQEDAKESETTVDISDSYTDTDVNGNSGTGNAGNEEEIIEIGDESEGSNDDARHRIRRSLSMDSDRDDGTRMSIADVLRLSMEDELLVAKECGLLVPGPGSSLSSGSHSKDQGRYNVLAVPMKRSFSGGRLFRNGRGRDSVLPISDNSSVR
ncbi:E3 ubiquitin-protein ligase Os04g0590900-like [Carex rostrata]